MANSNLFNPGLAWEAKSPDTQSHASRMNHERCPLLSYLGYGSLRGEYGMIRRHACMVMIREQCRLMIGGESYKIRL